VTSGAGAAPRQKVGDEFQVDLGNCDWRLGMFAGDRQAHVRFGSPAEIHRTVVNPMGDNSDKNRVIGEVGSAAYDVRCDPRNAQLLTAGAINFRNLGDSKGPLQQTHELDLPLLNVARH
jgi:hypothetical protein